MTTAVDLELYLFKICPYAQRALITLLQSGLSYRQNIFEPGNIPDDFKTISPLGNVPILRVDDRVTLFESAIITDYVAGISPISMEPDDLLDRARMRAWSEYSNSLLAKMMKLLQCSDEVGFIEANGALMDGLNLLEGELDSAGPFFCGHRFNTIDITYAPIFFRMQTLASLTDKFQINLNSRIKEWMGAVMAERAVQESIFENFPTIYRRFVSMRGEGKYLDTILE